MPGEISIVLADVKYSYERSAFSFIMLLGEIGGLFGAISGIPALLISRFVELSFEGAVSRKFVTKQELHQPAPKNRESNYRHTISEQAAKYDYSYELTAADVKRLALEADRLVKMAQVSFISQLYNWFCPCLGKEAKRRRLQRAIYNDFESRLDVKRIVGGQLDHLRLVNILLNR